MTDNVREWISDVVSLVAGTAGAPRDEAEFLASFSRVFVIKWDRAPSADEENFAAQTYINTYRAQRPRGIGAWGLRYRAS